MPLVKPAPWGVSRASAKKEHQSLWHGLGHLGLYWWKIAPVDAVGWVTPTTFTTDWTHEVTPIGPGVRRGSNDNRLIWADRPQFQLNGDIEFSCGVVQVMGDQESGGFIVARDINSPGYWELTSNDGTDIAFTFRDNADNHQGVTWAGAHPSLATFSEIHDFFVTRRFGGDFELWVDGVSQGVQTNTAIPGSQQHDLEIGRRGNNSDAKLGTYLATYVWQHRTLDDADVGVLHNDPFGLIRPATVQATNPVASLYATGDGSFSDVVNEDDLATGLFDSVDDDPATPTDTDWVNNAVGV